MDSVLQAEEAKVVSYGLKDRNWASPEESAALLAGQPLPAAKHCDVFSFGLVLWCASAGVAQPWPEGMPLLQRVQTLADEVAFSKRFVVEPAWPLAAVIRGCLLFDTRARLTADQVRAARHCV